MAKAKKSSVRDMVCDYYAKGKNKWDGINESAKKFNGNVVRFYNSGSNAINTGDNIYVLRSGFASVDYSTVLDNYINGKTVVYVKKIASTDTFDNFTKSVVESRTFVSKSQVNASSFFGTADGINTIDVKFSDVWIPVSSSSASTPSTLSSYFCKEYNNTYVSCDYKDATHNIVDFSKFDDRYDTVDSQMYKPSICCLVKLSSKITIEEGDGVKIENSTGVEPTSSSNTPEKDIKISATKIFVATVSAAWTQNSDRDNPINAVYNNNTIAIQSPLSQSGDTISAGKKIIVCKQPEDGSYLLLQAEC